MYQTTFDPPYWVGQEDMDYGPFYGGACPSGKACRYSETAMMMVATNSDADVHRGWIMRTTFSDPNQGSITIDAFPNNAFVVQGNDLTYPLMGEEADLMGATSGWTTGTVTATCQNMNLPSVPSHIHFGGQPYLLCQYTTSATSRPGDSSEPVFRQLGTTNGEGRAQVRLLGSAWGGTASGASPTIFSPMGGINADWLLTSYGMSWGF